MVHCKIFPKVFKPGKKPTKRQVSPNQGKSRFGEAHLFLDRFRSLKIPEKIMKWANFIGNEPRNMIGSSKILFG